MGAATKADSYLRRDVDVRTDQTLDGGLDMQGHEYLTTFPRSDQSVQPASTNGPRVQPTHVLVQTSIFFLKTGHL